MKKVFLFFSLFCLLVLLVPSKVLAIDGPARLKVVPTWLVAELKSVKMLGDNLCSIELLLTNTTDKDYNVRFNAKSVNAYDDEGNQYNSFVIILPNGERRENMAYDLVLPADIPVKYTLQIPGIKDEATTLLRVDWVEIMRLLDIPLNRGEF